MRHPTPEGSEPVNWERLTEEYFGEVQRLRAALKKCADKLERCAIHGGTDPEFAAECVKEFRALAG